MRIDPDHWHDIPEFSYRSATTGEKLRAAVLPGMILFVWLLAAGLFLRHARKRMLGAR